MEFKIIYGRSGSGKTSFIFNDIKKKIKGKNKIFIIVPEQFSFSAENRLLTVIDSNSSINAEVLTLSRMADRVISEVIGNYQTHLSKVGKTMIIYDVLEKLKGQLNFLRSSDKNLDLVFRMITEFKKHNINVTMINEVIENLDNKYLELKLKDAYELLNGYQKRIKENYIDESDSLELLYENIEKVSFFDDSIIYIDEFAGFTPNEYMIIEKLCLVAKEINVTICTDSLEKIDNIDESIFYFNKITVEKLLKIAKRMGCYIEKIDLGDSKRFKSNELFMLEKNIYSSLYNDESERTKDISLFIAKNVSSECEYVAEQILKLVKDEGYRYRDIAIVSGNMELYSADLKVIFQNYNIPVFIDEKKDISNNILMKFMISLLNIFTNNFSYDSVFSYIKAGVLNISNDEIYLLENYVNKWGIRGNKWYSDFVFEEKNELQDQINEIRKRIVIPILEFKNSLIGQKTAEEITKNLFDFIYNNDIQKNILIKAQELENIGEIEAAEEYRAGIRIFFDVLDEIYMIFGNEKMSFERYNKILQIGIAQSEFGRIPTSFDQVLFGDIDRSKTKEIKILFMIGLNDGVIPNVVKDEGFLNDDDRRILKENNMEIAKNSLELLYENQFNIYKCLSMPENKLFLSYIISDNEGHAYRNSILVTQIKKIFPNLTEKSDVIVKNNDITTKEATLEIAIEKYNDFINDEEILPKWKEVILWYKNNDKIRMNKILEGASYSNLPDKICNDNIKEMYGNSLKTSVSRLEQYRRCPFSFYLKYGLKLKEEDEFKIRSLDTGNFMHEVIDEFFSKIEEKKIDIKTASREELDIIVMEIINQKLKMSKNYIFSSSTKFIVLTQRLKKVVCESIGYIVDQLKNSKFEIYGHEIEFSEKSQFKPMKIELENGKNVIVTGKIDRIDIAKMSDNTYVRIIDYKSSVKDINLNQVVSGIQIQLLTYLNEVVEQSEFDSAGILYFNLLDTIVKADKNLSDEEIRKQLNKKFRMKGLVVADIDIVKLMDTNISPANFSNNIPVYLDKEGNISNSRSSVLDREKFERLQRYTKHIIAEISNEIFNGNINMYPFYMNKKTQCDYCEYKSICNFNSKFKGNKYNYISNMSKEEILAQIKELE